MKYTGIYQHAIETACFLSFKMTRSKWFNDYEREDIEQELILEYLIKISKYDDDRGSPNTFINAVMVNKARNMLDAMHHHI